ncbi:calcium-dependent protein kinase 2 isoform X2 [Cryptomeria japonica]|uniref:calcium-dependent protein kinase 2 isoform X2 n=1 Tax=Cryptomeria japonica TaxID=3369 RepID=UPI0027D9E113|nr:calcium-dependent protein kinase 2 isoform X2 [Cryptomeria japonica]
MDKCREENSKRRIMYSSELGCPLLDRANSEKCREENSEGRIMYSSLTEELGCPLLDSANSALWISAADNLAKMAKFFKKRLLPCLSNQQAQVIQGSVEDHYILDWVIDNCATHKIRACYLKASRNPVFCCKSFYKECDGGENAGTIFQSELQIMHRLRNQCGIVKLKGGYEDSQFFHLVMEYCKEGDLWHFVERNGGLWNAEYEASCIFRQIVNAIQSCHRMGILHGDIKLRNVFLSSTGRDWEIKLGDFGSSKVFSKGEIFKGDIIGTLPYMAPEILQSQGYCEAVDIWSAGVLLYKLLCGYYPFGEILPKILYPEY